MPGQRDIVGEITLKLGEGVTGWAAKEKKPVALSSMAYKDPRFKSFTNLAEDRFEAFLARADPVQRRDHRGDERPP